MNARFENLQALRGLACLLVVATHIAGIEARFGLDFHPLRPLLWFGFASVDYFFVMSGFIMTLTCRRHFGRPAELPRYVGRRFWRIFPIYWVGLLVGLPVYLWLSPMPLSQAAWPTELVDTLFLLPLPQGAVHRVLPVAWTLTYEVVFYVGFAVLHFLPPRLAVPALLGWIAAALGAIAVGPLENRFLAYAVSPFVLEFAVGGLIALLPVRLSGWAALGVTAVGLAWAVVASVLAFDPDPQRLPTDHARRVAVFGVPVMLLTFAVAGLERTGPGCRWKRLVTVGDASFSIYLAHMPAIISAWHLTDLAHMSHSRSGHTLWIALMLAAGLLPGLLLHFLVEAPLLRLAKRPRPTDPLGRPGFLTRLFLRRPRQST